MLPDPASQQWSCAGSPQAVRAEPIRLAKRVTVAEAFQVIARSCLRHAALNARLVRDGDAEGIHQMRVALRRLRAAISLFHSVLCSAETQAVKAQLRWLTEQLGPARDYDVLVEESVVPMKRSGPHRREIAQLEVVLRAERSLKAADARAAVESDRYARFMQETSFWLAGGEWAQTQDDSQRRRRQRRLKPLARKTLTRRTKRLTRGLKRLSRLQPAERHKLRIAVKKLHYGTQFFAALFGRKSSSCKRFVRRLERLQALLGRLNDLRIHETLIERFVQPSGATPNASSPDVAYAIGLVTATEATHVGGLVKAATRAGAKLARLPRFWD